MIKTMQSIKYNAIFSTTLDNNKLHHKNTIIKHKSTLADYNIVVIMEILIHGVMLSMADSKDIWNWKH